MGARRLITVMIVLLVLSSIAAALVPVERGADDESSTSSSTATTTETAGQAVERTISVAKAKPTKIRLGLGDRLELTVRSQAPAQIAIPDFGELEDTDQYLPAHFDLLPFKRGSSPVLLRREDGSGRTVARIIVKTGSHRTEKRPGRSQRAS
ncbi:MAG TPA: hypothetical protein VK326_08360 [Solirubrobacterales bacterium]|nr:hypothetical protein [Solirubrobacterales bacterium]